MRSTDDTAPDSGGVPIDVTPLVHLPAAELFAIFDDIEPGSDEARSVARVLHSIAAYLTGERLGISGHRLRFWGPHEDFAKSAQRAVELLELAEALDGIGLSGGNRSE